MAALLAGAARPLAFKFGAPAPAAFRSSHSDGPPSFASVIRGLSPTFWLALVAYVAFVVAVIAFRDRRGLPSPSAAELDELNRGHTSPSAAFFKWAKKYGPLLSFKSGAKTVVVLNNISLVSDLFHKRAANVYANKPHHVVAHDILSGGMRGQGAPFGVRWAKWRKVLDDGLNETALRAHRDLLDAESALLVRDLLRGTVEPHVALQRFVDSTLVGISYGRHAAYDDAHTAAHVAAKEAYQDASKPGQYFVETFPFLARLPSFFFSWRPAIDAARSRATDLYVTSFRGARAPSIASSTNSADAGMSEVEIAYTLSAPFSEGREPLLWSIQWCIAATLLFPATQQTLHTELDAVYPPSTAPRLPTLDDVALRLPRLRIFVRECARYWPIVPLVRRATAREDTVEKHTIPEGSVVIANVDAIAKDDALFPSARDFTPERFLDPAAHDIDFLFGAGVRACPGKHLAIDATTLAFARILWAFEIARAPDAELPRGNAFAYRGDARGPAPFRFTLRPRGAGADVIEREAAEAERWVKSREE